jgi:hypothetical protein
MEAEWDPDPKDREYFRECTSGQLGWLVRREGVDRIKLDRAMDICVPYGIDWLAESDHRPLNMAHLAQVAFAADRMLNRFLGNQENAVKQWESLSDEQRRGWIETGPKNEGMRKDLYQAVMAALARHAK